MGEILRIAKKGQAGGRDALTDDELFLLAGFGALAGRAVAGRTEQQRADTKEGFEIFESLPAEEQEKYEDWTPAELQALWPLLKEQAEHESPPDG
jgi:hypothetical protein